MWTFDTVLRWIPEAGEEAEAAAEGGKPPIRVTPPADLGGKAGRWTPEDLLVSAIESCMLMTVLSVAGKQKIGLRGYRSTAKGRMEKTPQGLRITGVDITVDATVSLPDEVEKFARAVSIAERYCPVSAAVNFACRVDVNCRAG